MITGKKSAQVCIFANILLYEFIHCQTGDKVSLFTSQTRIQVIIFTDMTR